MKCASCTWEIRGPAWTFSRPHLKGVCLDGMCVLALPDGDRSLIEYLAVAED